MKQHIERLVTEKDGCAKNWYDCRADIAAAVEVLREAWHGWYSPSEVVRDEAWQRIGAFLARLEVKT